MNLGLADRRTTVMKKVIGLALIGVLSLGLVAPAFADGGRGGWHGRGGHGWRGGGGHGWHGGGGHGWRGGGAHGWWGPGAVIGGLLIGSAIVAASVPRVVYPAPVYPEPVYVAPLPTYYPQTQVYAAPVRRDVCYPTGCYRLYGDGVTVAYQWVWEPSPAAPVPPAPPAPPYR
jgi:hypothetical protein